MPKLLVGCSVDGQNERARPLPRRHARVCFGELGAVSAKSVRAPPPVARRNCLALAGGAREIASVGRAACASAAARSPAVDVKTIRARLRVEIDADERVPFLPLFVVVEREVLPEHGRRDLLVARSRRRYRHVRRRRGTASTGVNDTKSGRCPCERADASSTQHASAAMAATARNRREITSEVTISLPAASAGCGAAQRERSVQRRAHCLQRAPPWKTQKHHVGSFARTQFRWSQWRL